jgi:hypothetical protein
MTHEQMQIVNFSLKRPPNFVSKADARGRYLMPMTQDCRIFVAASHLFDQGEQEMRAAQQTMQRRRFSRI